MENNFEKWRSRARCVASVDMLWIIFHTLGFLPIAFIWYLASRTQPKLLKDTIVYSVIILTIIVTEFCATILLLRASNKDNNVSAEKTICWTGFWYYLNMLLLFIGIIFVSYAFQPRPNWAFLVGIVVFIRTLMLCTVKMYLNNLCERGSEATDFELQTVYAASSAREGNDSQYDQV